MKKKLVILTCSFRGDFDRFCLLHQSVVKHAVGILHVVVVASKDFKLFTKIKSSKLLVVKEQDILPEWINKGFDFLRHKLFLSRTFFIRGWILQQFRKLAFCANSDWRFVVIVDSDSLFVKDVSVDDFIFDGKSKLFCQKGRGAYGMHLKWHESAMKILALKQKEQYTGYGYITHPVCWDSELVNALKAHIEDSHKGSWLNIISRYYDFSEYTLYGIYCKKFHNDSDVNFSDEIEMKAYWDNSPMTKHDLVKFKASLRGDEKLVMISSKSRTRVDHIKEVFKL